MARRRKHEEEHENSERWLLTYADMITLLMAFFIMLYTLSRVDGVKMGVVAQNLRERLNFLPISFGTPDQGSGIFKTSGEKSGSPLGGDSRRAQGKYQMTLKAIHKTLKRNQVDDLVKMNLSPKGMVISLVSDKIAFDLQSAELKPDAKKVLDTLGPVLQPIANQISIEGNTDEMQTIQPNGISSNWQLSMARASSVMSYLVQKKYLQEDQIILTANSANRPSVATAGMSLDDQKRLNRRVDIILLGESLQHRGNLDPKKLEEQESEDQDPR